MFIPTTTGVISVIVTITFFVLDNINLIIIVLLKVLLIVLFISAAQLLSGAKLSPGGFRRKTYRLVRVAWELSGGSTGC